ncbi:carboxylesterase 1 [Quercus suber]|uniref:Carboxylesterase 1 n=1 Tax=Quercus suber TaxID=58331 RepID=A0AAW0J9L7_QUESU
MEKGNSICVERIGCMREMVELGVWIGARSLELIKGLILHHPFFGGSKRTESELRLLNAPVLPLYSTDLPLYAALPIAVELRLTVIMSIAIQRELGWWVVVTGCDGDLLIDRQMELVEMLKKKGVKVGAQFNEGDYHGVELIDATEANALFVFLMHFLEKC